MNYSQLNTRLLPMVASIIAIVSTPAFADADNTPTQADPSVTLETIKVKGVRNKVASTEQISRTELDNKMIRDVRDLVRYSPDVGIADSGRHLKGFAMRGVEGNRVGISIDGVSLPDSEENTLYSRYGNFNPSRLSIDTELVRNIELQKGSNSFTAGSGALGGNVEYRTLNASDIIKDNKDFGTMVRSGYNSKNSEWTNTVGVGYQGDALEMVALYTERKGHELKSNGNGFETQGDKSQKPDPAEHRQRSYLGKLAWQINPEHRVGISINGQNGKNYTDERSYNLHSNAWREADDRQKRTNGNIFYEYTPASTWLAGLRAEYDHQKAEISAINYKGGRDWQTNAKQLDEIFDRRIKNRFERLSFSGDFQPFALGGEHSLALKAHIARRDFENINHDRGGIGRSYEYTDIYTIQHPMRTEQLGLSFKDGIWWNDALSSDIGIRYDHEKVSPQNLNAKCSTACTAEGKPAGKSFDVWSGFANLKLQLNPAWKTSYQIGTGYRIPTASEMYFSFKNPYGTWQSNPNLKQERSISHSISLQGYGNYGVLDVSAYQSRYRDFLSEQTSLIEKTEYGRTYQTPVNQTVNIDKARISGLELQGKLNLDTITNAPQGWKVFGSFGYSKGKLSVDSSLLSIQPAKVIIGLDYEQPDGKWGVFSRLSHLGGKNARNAKVEDVKKRCTAYEYDYWFDEEICTRHELYKETTAAKYLNKAAYTFDIFGFYKPNESITLRAGVYNLFNQRYHTWDALRGLNSYGTTNTVDADGKGLERFYAPGRNFALALEYKF
ncbi:TonB-dependent hemoglobin/transferrin/lactoferrin family receptor [Moraxella marmotae]|uniref:TonB-dependent hemoglobin/transferrin/lactoferrin family receptor n=1 Tax=Moraxella marmotae TaxID=3344520 RepID=UPI0035F444D6